MKLTKKLVLASALVVLAGTLAGFRLLSPRDVSHVLPEDRHLVERVFGTGTVEARVMVQAGSKLTGRVKELYADEGDRVAGGQVLAVLDSDDLRALVRQSEDSLGKSLSLEEKSRGELERAKAALASAIAALRKSEAAMELAEKTFVRYEELYDRGLISGQELDEKQAALKESFRNTENLESVVSAARADIKVTSDALEAAMHETGSARAMADYARSRLADTEIVAAIDGIVVSRDVELGDPVVPGSVIFRIADPDTVWVEANIDEAQGGGIAVGSPAEVLLRTSAGNPVPGHVARIAQESDRVTEEMKVYVFFELEDKGRLHIGEQAEVHVRGRQGECLSVPKAAVTVRDGRQGVFVVDKGRARFTLVKTGIWTEDFVEVKSGLVKDDRVILLDGGLMRGLQSGDRVSSAAATPRGVPG